MLGQFVREEALISPRGGGALDDVRARRPARPDGPGRVADGIVADLVVFDPARVRSTATYEEPRQFPDGIEWVIVAGEVVVEGGQHTGARPGRVVRGGR